MTRIICIGGLAALLAACAGTNKAAEGEEGGACFPDDTCNAGLRCVFGRCVADATEDGSPSYEAGADAPGAFDGGVDQGETDQGETDQGETDHGQADHGGPGGGVHSWSQAYGDAQALLGSDLWDVAVDAAGNLYVTGAFQASWNVGGQTLQSSGKNDIFVASYDASGAHRWSKRFGGSEHDAGMAIAVDSQGNIYLAGQFSGSVSFGGSTLVSTGSGDGFVASFSSSGAHRWSTGFGSAGGGDSADGLAVDGADNVYFTGTFTGTIDLGGGAMTSDGPVDHLVASYTAGGAHRWSKTFPQPIAAIAADSSGNVYLTGGFNTSLSYGGSTVQSNGESDAYVAALAASGAFRWLEGLGGSDADRAHAVATDGAGNVYITGEYDGTSTPPLYQLTPKVFAASLTTGGVVRWSNSYGAPNQRNRGTAVATDASGNVYLVGQFEGSVDLGGGPLQSGGAIDLFVASLTDTGGHRWSRSFGGTGTDRVTGRAVAVSESGGVDVGGVLKGSVDFGGGLLQSSGVDYVFLLQLGL